MIDDDQDDNGTIHPWHDIHGNLFVVLSFDSIEQIGDGSVFIKS